MHNTASKMEGLQLLLEQPQFLHVGNISFFNGVIDKVPFKETAAKVIYYINQESTTECYLYSDSEEKTPLTLPECKAERLTFTMSEKTILKDIMCVVFMMATHTDRAAPVFVYFTIKADALEKFITTIRKGNKPFNLYDYVNVLQWKNEALDIMRLQYQIFYRFAEKHVNICAFN